MSLSKAGRSVAGGALSLAGVVAFALRDSGTSLERSYGEERPHPFESSRIWTIVV